MLNLSERRRIRRETAEFYEQARMSGMGHDEAADETLDKMREKYGTGEREGIAEWLAIIQLIMQLIDMFKPKSR